MRHFFLLILLICFSKFVLGQENVILPLSIGNYWEFELDYGSFQDTSKVEITNGTIINYQNNDYMVYFWQWEYSDKEWLIRNQNDGLWAYGLYSIDYTVIAPELSLKYPASVGDTWQNSYFWTGDTVDTVIVECIATDTIISTPAGTFNCYGYTDHSQTGNQSIGYNPFYQAFEFKEKHRNIIKNGATILPDGLYLFMSPGIGYVKSIIVENNNVVYETTLLSYNIVTSIKDSPPLKLDFLLYQNYPNPFNPATNIQYAISSRRFVSLKVYDLIGNEITTLVNEEKPAGAYTVEFDASKISSGIYFYQLRAGDFIKTKKMILMR